MKIKNKNFKATDFDDYLREELKNPESKKLFDEYGRQLELAYSILQLRKKKKISQEVLAKKIGTTQSNVARMESGQQNFSIGFLEKIAVALGAELKISLR
jgi:ribosome-binding protein aMBF1 (putative translation factor)